MLEENILYLKTTSHGDGLFDPRIKWMTRKVIKCIKAVVLAAATDQRRGSGSIAYVANMMNRMYLINDVTRHLKKIHIPLNDELHVRWLIEQSNSYQTIWVVNWLVVRLTAL